MSLILNFIKEKQIEYVNFRFTDLLGRGKQITLPASKVNKDTLNNGINCDGSSFIGWQKIHKAELLLKPDENNFFIDPFCSLNTLVVYCNVYDSNNSPYIKDPRNIANLAEQYMKSEKIADKIFLGPELEFMIFDEVSIENNTFSSSFSLSSNDDDYSQGSYLVNIKEGYFNIPPYDKNLPLREEIIKNLEAVGLDVEMHHHEVGNSQYEIGVKFNTLLNKADEIQTYKYILTNTAAQHDKVLTFMPKPVYGDNGNGMHIHFSMLKSNKNIFLGNEYSNLSQTALYFIGGVLKHTCALNAFTNPTTNSYRRLIPGYEAPVCLAYSKNNRSVAIRIPLVSDLKATRVELRFPDPMANPYLAFAATLMAGIDGIKNKINPPKPAEKDMFNDDKELAKYKTISTSLEMSLEALQKDNKFLLAGNVFNESLLNSYISVKSEEAKLIKSSIPPKEVELYL